MKNIWTKINTSAEKHPALWAVLFAVLLTIALAACSSAPESLPTPSPSSIESPRSPSPSPRVTGSPTPAPTQLQTPPPTQAPTPRTTPNPIPTPTPSPPAVAHSDFPVIERTLFPKPPPDYLAYFQTLPDDELAWRLAGHIDLSLRDALLFTDPETIPSEALFMLFLIKLNVEHYEYGRDREAYYDPELNLYIVPLADVRDTLDRYLESYILEPNELYGWDAEQEAFLWWTLSGFGGDRWPKLTERIWDGNLLTITVDFCDEPRETVFYTKTYRVRVYADRYVYLSIVLDSDSR